MSGTSAIEWTDVTWNPVVGCSRVSEGCRHCYAERHAARLEGNPLVTAYEGISKSTDAGPRWTGKVRLVPERLAWPLKYKGHPSAAADGRMTRVFVNSMSDLFHEALSFTEIAAVFGVMAKASHLDFQVLTKRPPRASEWYRWIADLGAYGSPEHVEEGLCRKQAWLQDRDDLPQTILGTGGAPYRWPLPNVSLGTSVEDQATANQRILHLVECPAVRRFVSYEPALGPVDFRRIQILAPSDDGLSPGAWLDSLTGHVIGPDDLTELKVHWVIAGGESGPGARPSHPAWFEDVRAACAAAQVPFFFKQWGAWTPGRTPGREAVVHLHDGTAYDEQAITEGRVDARHLRAAGTWKSGLLPTWMTRVGKAAAGRELFGRIHDAMPEVPRV